MIKSQGQKAGDNSSQFQATTMFIQTGIDEKRAREIYQEMHVQLKKEYSTEAMKIANSRIGKFENKLVSKMEKVEGALHIFADPSFQLLLLEAQKTAAGTERIVDYDLLSELLIHRFKAGENRITRAGINRAVEIVDEISDDALLGMTIAYTIFNIKPSSNDLHQGLDALDNIFSKIFYSELPSGFDWIDHLEILNTIRINSIYSPRNIEDIYKLSLSDYIDLGIKISSENYSKVMEIIEINNLPKDIIKEHELNKEYCRVAILKEQIEHASLIKNDGLTNEVIPFTAEQKKATERIYDLYDDDPVQKQNNISSLMVEWEKRPTLKILRRWWDGIKINFQITSVGNVLAHSNLQRCDNSVPNLDEF